jgi:cytochrome c oxidase subunit III
MNPTRNYDASQLPDHAFGTQTVLGWGTLGFIAVESTVFAALFTSYLYGMARADEWPPPPYNPPALVFGLINGGLILASLVPAIIYKRAAENLNLRTCRICMIILLVLETVFLAVRGVEFTRLEPAWDVNFYGSIMWVTLAFHTLLVFGDVIETALLFALSFRRGLKPHRFSDMADNAFYWYFIIVLWVPLFVLIYLAPRWN